MAKNFANPISSGVRGNCKTRAMRKIDDFGGFSSGLASCACQSVRRRREHIPNVIEDLDLRPSQSPGIGRSNLAPISNRGDDSIAPIAGAFASVLNQTFSHVGYRFDRPIPGLWLGPKSKFSITFGIPNESGKTVS